MVVFAAFVLVFADKGMKTISDDCDLVTISFGNEVPPTPLGTGDMGSC